MSFADSDNEDTIIGGAHGHDDREDNFSSGLQPSAPPPQPPAPQEYTALTTVPLPSPESTPCRISVLIHRPHTILVTTATKVADGLTASAFVAYTIKIGENEVKRRYSEFESLRNVLCRIYPTLIVPPIPEKHSITDYANIQNKSKEDAVMVEKRKRMLQKFLNRLAKHEILSKEHVFHRFLEAGVSWAELLHCPPISELPKNPLNAKLTASTSSSSMAQRNNNDSSQPSSPSASHHSSPTGSSSTGAPTVPPPMTREPSGRFIDSELFTQKFANHLSNSMDRSQKKVVRKLHELANDNSELGATLNGFSLNESESVQLSNAIEKVGQAVDSSFMATTALMQALEVHVNEPMQEYVQYANIIKAILKFRHSKHLISEKTADSLENKRNNLENLERMEIEAKRIEDALKRDRGSMSTSASSNNNNNNNNNSATTPTPIMSSSASGLSGGEEATFSNEPEEDHHHHQEDSSTNHFADSSTDVPYNPYAQARQESAASKQGSTPNPYSHGNPPINPYSSPSNPYAQSGNPPSSSSSTKRRSTRLNVFSALSHTLHGIIDVDPEATRRNNIGKTRDAIEQLEVQLETSSSDLDLISKAIQTDLDRFQKQKIKDLRDILLAYAKAHQKWSQKNLGSWQEAKDTVESIEV